MRLGKVLQWLYGVSVRVREGSAGYVTLVAGIVRRLRA